MEPHDPARDPEENGLRPTQVTAPRSHGSGPQPSADRRGVAGGRDRADGAGEQPAEIARDRGDLERAEHVGVGRMELHEARAGSPRVVQPRVAVAPVEVTSPQGAVERAGETGGRKAVAELAIGVVVELELGRGETDGERVGPAQRDVASPERVEHAGVAGLDALAGGLVLRGVEPGGRPVHHLGGNGHVADHDPPGAVTVPQGVSGDESGLGHHVVVEEEDHVAPGDLHPRLQCSELAGEAADESDDPGVALGQPGDHGIGAVTAGIVHEDELEGRRILEHRPGEGSDAVAPVVGGDDDRDRRGGVCFLAWGAVKGRSGEIASAIGGDAISLYPPGPGRRPPVLWRYLRCSVTTAAALRARRPGLVIVTNPPIFAALVAYACGRVLGFEVALDSHPGGFGAQGDRVAAKLQWLHRAMVRRVGFSMVASEHWAGIVRSFGGRAVVVHEAPMFPLAVRAARPDSGRLSVLYVGRFASDEPFEEVIAAAALRPGVDVTVTGELAACPAALRDRAPGNVTFAGFLGPKRYRAALEACDVVISLTTEPESVMRAAYEATYIGRPLVVSDWPVAREVFPHAVHVRNEAVSIAGALDELASGYAEAAERCPEARQAQLERWRRQQEAVEQEISRIRPASRRRWRGRSHQESS